MAEGGSLTFRDPEPYIAAFGDIGLTFTIAGAGDFTARLTRMKLQNVDIYWCCESVPRIAFISLPNARVVFTFPLGSVPQITCGLALRSGDLVFHGHGDRVHQRFGGHGQWGLISFSDRQFEYISRALTGRPITSPPRSRVLKPTREASLRFHRLFRKARRFAEVSNELIARHEVVRAMEEEVLHTVVQCITDNQDSASTTQASHRASIMARFEDALSKQIDRNVNIADLCTEIGVSERVLRTCCAQILGLSPLRYVLLRRLNRVRAALGHADPSTTSVSEIARMNQFVEFGRFAAHYRDVFGELPSATLQRQPEKGGCFQP